MTLWTFTAPRRSTPFPPDKNNHGFRYSPFKSIIVPRPIGWISTLSRDGVPIERVRHAWSRAAGGTTVRRGVRSEHRLPGTDGEWMHVDVEFGGLRMAVGGVR